MLDNLLVYQEKGRIPNKEFSLFCSVFSACGFLYMVFCVVKGHVLHFKRCSFIPQKGIFCIAKGRLLKASF